MTFKFKLTRNTTEKKYATGNTIIYYHEGTCNIAAAVENIYYYVSSHAKSSR